MAGFTVARGFSKLVAYSPGGIVSRQLEKGRGTDVSVFAFDAGQGLSSHASAFPATILVLSGTALLSLGAKKVAAKAGDLVFMPKGLKHAVLAKTRMKMLLVLAKP
ncbi:MAG: cupin domain-containing protein [Candidatus Micrarchaeia archaeon]|jgi:quercetin dioxygenase-like cupin family protein